MADVEDAAAARCRPPPSASTPSSTSIAEEERRRVEDDRSNQHQIDAAKRIDMQVRFDEALHAVRRASARAQRRRRPCRTIAST